MQRDNFLSLLPAKNLCKACSMFSSILHIKFYLNTCSMDLFDVGSSLCDSVKSERCE